MMLDDLRQFERFSELTDVQLLLLQPFLTVKRFNKPGEVLLPCGYSEDTEYFLLSGEVELIAEDDRKKRVAANTPEARHALAQLRPSLYEVKTLSSCQVACIPSAAMKWLFLPLPRYPVAQPELSLETKKFYRLLAYQLDNQMFSLQSLSRLAQQHLQLVQYKDVTLEQLDQQVRLDPVMCATLISLTNQVSSSQKCLTSGQALKYLKQDRVVSLLGFYAQQSTFNPQNPWIKARAIRNWIQAQKTAQLAQLLASLYPQLSRILALQLGLLHNLGELALLQLMDKESDLHEAHMEKILEEAGLPATLLLLSHLHLSGELIGPLEQLYNWDQPTNPKNLGLTEVLRIAYLQGYTGNQQKHLPRLDDVPAFQYMKRQGLTAERNFALLNNTEQRLVRLRQQVRM